MMRRALFALFLVAGLLSGVSIHGELPPEFVPFPFSTETVPTLRANSGETVTLDARDFIHGSGASELKRVYGADFSTSITAASQPEDPCEIRVSFSPDMQGVHIVPLVFEWTEARRSRMDVAVFLQKKFEAEFTYRQGKAVKSVSVAGTFNGWNMARNPLNDDDGDGVWTARVAMEPGEHKYKFVVDGEWIPDPSNPLQESGGYSNSILKAGEALNDPIPRLIPLKSRKSGAFMEYSFLYLDASGKHPAGRERHVLIGNEEVVLETMQEDNTIMFRVPVEAAREKPVRVFVRSHGVLWAEEACIIEAKQGGKRPYDWRDAAIYFVFTDRFYNGDTSNDAPVKDERLAPRADWHGGDFAGIEQKIREGYFTKLGVNTLWLSPANRNAGGAWRDSLPPNRYFTGYHGYWPVAPRETEPRFGSMDDLKRLINTAHKSGIRVILDFVTNHTHRDHPYFQEHRDWFGTLDLPDGRKNIRLFDEHPFTTWFDTFLPSFDYPASPEARAQTIADGLWWIEETQADGLRHDATKHIPLVFWKELCRELRERIEIPRGIKLYQVGETISDRETIMRFVGPGLLTGQFDYPLAWKIRDAFAQNTAGLDDLMREAEESRRAYGSLAVMSPFVGSHDIPRFISFCDGDLPDKELDEKEVGWKKDLVVDNPESYDKMFLAMAFVMTQPGAPLMYYGDEIGMPGAGDPDNRRMMRFGKDLSAHEMRLLDRTGAVARLRAEHAVLRHGEMTPVFAGKETLAFLKAGFDEKIVCVFHRGGDPVRIRLAMPEGLGRVIRMTPLLKTGKAVPGDGAEVEMPARSVEFFQLKTR